MKNNLESFSKLGINNVLDNINKDSGNAFISVNNEISEDTKKYIAIKDIHAHKNYQVTSASKMLEQYIAPYDSTVVKKLKKKGYTIVGHTNLDEYAMGSSNLSSYFGGVDNVLASNLSSGGSSGGSAYAVAKNLVPVATGTDTGGSVRQPAALNGIYGLKPTYGVISRYGTHALSSSFDAIGVLANDISDLGMVLNDLSGTDYRDQTSYTPEGYDCLKSLNNDVKGMKIAKIKEWEEAITNEEIRNNLNETYKKLESLGCIIEEVSCPTCVYSFELYLSLGYAEAASNLNRYDGIVFGENEKGDFKKSRDAFGIEVKKRLIIGSFMLSNEHASDYYIHSQKVRNKMKKEFKTIFSKYDLVVGPMIPNLFISKEIKMSSREGYLSDIFAIPANLCALPSLSAPSGKSKENYNFAVQIMADKYNEDKILNLATKLEELNV